MLGRDTLQSIYVYMERKNSCTINMYRIMKLLTIYDRLAFGVGFVIYFLTAVKYDFRPSLLCAVCVYTCALLREGNPDIHLAL
jgi:hypothetical protein